MKYINFKRFKFSTAVKSFDNLIYNFSKILKLLNFKKPDLTNFFKYFAIRKYDLSKLKKANFINTKFLFFHLPAITLFFSFLYIAIPIFYKYDKSDIQNILCKSNNIECLINGDISYNFYPTPRLKIKDVVINDIAENKTTIANVDTAVIKLSYKNLLAKDKQCSPEHNLRLYLLF